MAAAKFLAGESVAFVSAQPPFAPGVYKIIRALPTEGRPRRYRVKSDSEVFERIVDESRLEAVRNG